MGSSRDHVDVKEEEDGKGKDSAEDGGDNMDIGESAGTFRDHIDDEDSAKDNGDIAAVPQ